MKITSNCIYLSPLFLVLILLTSCSAQDKQEKEFHIDKIVPNFLEEASDRQIAQYIRHMFQDRNGNFWFGTNGYGAAHYDGHSVNYFSHDDGFSAHQITGITEDVDKNIWFSTDKGVVKYDWSSNDDGTKKFTNYTDQKYFEGQRFWSIFADSKNNIWAGSERGLYKCEGGKWKPFKLPISEEITGQFITDITSMSISEDNAGNMWFSTMGYGAFKYDDQSFTRFSKKDGLADDSVDVILEARNGDIWFGTRNGGVSRFDGNTFTNYTANDSIGNNEICVIYEDREGDIWFSSEGFGVYRYNGKSLTNYSQNQGLKVKAVQTIFEDREGRFWVGGGGGLYRFDGTSFYNVTKDGPWK